MTAYPIHYNAYPDQQQGNYQRPDRREMEELLQEIAEETRQPSGTTVCLADIVPVKQEQCLLLPTYQVIGIYKKEEPECRQKSKCNKGIFQITNADSTFSSHTYFKYTKKKYIYLHN